MAFFDVTLTTHGSLHPDGEPSDFISCHTGTVRCTRDDGRVRRVGRVRAYRVHADLAREAGESVLEACDCYSAQLLAAYAAVFDVATDDFQDEIRDDFDGHDGDLLVIDYVLLSPKWRGLRLGLLAVRKMIDLLSGGCGLVVCDISPLNPESSEFAAVLKRWIPKHERPDERRAARRKLRRYFRTMGFRRIAGTSFHGLSTVQTNPTLADLLRGSTRNRRSADDGSGSADPA